MVGSFNHSFNNYQTLIKKVPKERGLSPLFNSRSKLCSIRNLMINDTSKGKYKWNFSEKIISLIIEL